MSKFAEPMSRLIDELKKLPGVGSKSAQRLAFYILRASDEDAEALATAVRDVKASLRRVEVRVEPQSITDFLKWKNRMAEYNRGTLPEGIAPAEEELNVFLEPEAM